MIGQKSVWYAKGYVRLLYDVDVARQHKPRSLEKLQNNSSCVAKLDGDKTFEAWSVHSIMKNLPFLS